MASTGAVAIVRCDVFDGCGWRAWVPALAPAWLAAVQRVFIGPRYAGQPILVASKHTSAAGQPSPRARRRVGAGACGI